MSLGLSVFSDHTPGAAPAYDCGRGEVLTYAWDIGDWIDAKIGPKKRRCLGVNVEGSDRYVVSRVAEAIPRLVDCGNPRTTRPRKGGKILVSWYRNVRNGVVTSLLWSRRGVGPAAVEGVKGEELQDWPLWWPVRNADLDLLTVLEVGSS